MSTNGNGNGDAPQAEQHDPAKAVKHLEAATKLEDAGDRIAAIEEYEQAFANDPENADVCFQLARNLDMLGEEEEAIHLYEICVHRPNPALNALINLAVLYEDRGNYAAAERCVRQVLATNPNHDRACLYIKDIAASREMVVEEEADLTTHQHAVLETPVTDFDMQVRTRNALRKMNIRTLGDLLRISEAELRSYKNLGEASIEEVKAMLAQRGLKLGQAIEAQESEAKQAAYDQLKAQSDPDAEALLEKSVNELQLSVRARKALALLTITSIGDLCLRTEAELMGVKNFGSTSLTEIKAKLTEFGLSLRQPEG